MGTILFFFSLAGFILYVVKKNNKVYFKGLNIFIVKQINSKVNTNFLSMSVICLMLFLTIGMLSTGLSFKEALESGLKGSTPYDASAYMYVSPEDKARDIEKSLQLIGIKFDKDDKVAYFNEYKDDKKIKDVITTSKDIKNSESLVYYVKVSDYNKLRELNNEKPINLKENEVLITSNFSRLIPSIEKYMKDNDTIKLDNKTYNIKNNKVI